MTKRTRTDQEMLDSGRWAKAGRKHYRHESGVEVEYDHNAWLWRVSATGRGYQTLWAARYEAEKAAA